MENDFKTLENIIRLPHQYAAGEVFTRFHDGLRERTIQGTVCDSCARVLVPPRFMCPYCHSKMSRWVVVPGEGSLVTWTFSKDEYFGMPAGPPLVTALIRLDNTDCDFLHIIGGIDMDSGASVGRQLERGTRLRAVWNENRSGHLMDIRYFEPVS